jgi:hypothetical protein
VATLNAADVVGVNLYLILISTILRSLRRKCSLDCYVQLRPTTAD